MAVASRHAYQVTGRLEWHQPVQVDGRGVGPLVGSVQQGFAQKAVAAKFLGGGAPIDRVVVYHSLLNFIRHGASLE